MNIFCTSSHSFVFQIPFSWRKYFVVIQMHGFTRVHCNREHIVNGNNEINTYIVRVNKRRRIRIWRTGQALLLNISLFNSIVNTKCINQMDYGRPNFIPHWELQFPIESMILFTIFLLFFFFFATEKTVSQSIWMKWTFIGKIMDTFINEYSTHRDTHTHKRLISSNWMYCNLFYSQTEKI